MLTHQRVHWSYPSDYSQEEGVQSDVQVGVGKRNKDEEGPERRSRRVDE